ncbi:uncharacterized protein Z518_03320 [Rhinocladiella mackenziei CBS 650.93]|uniref:Protein kinase domain-containing protein n=1 Tax=Rhinocladiella mackenziei CBS 650.93 TaxID=1442369 RepID=A0A0D2HDN7_9EURO|nr:uncharacterized protein Z518_03320 [Rhinocladiella mackenziei CBS 650.93]KIX08663.1 hypothetical protein Z518_03320 [Rhinocladiella mackenziei CBS 650.93]
MVWYEQECNKDDIKLREDERDTFLRDGKGLRNGHFVISGKDNLQTDPYSLEREEEILETYFKGVLRFVVEHLPKHLVVDVFWDFYRPTRIPDTAGSFSEAVSHELEKTIRENFEGDKYFPPDLVNRIFSKEVTERIISEDPSLEDIEKTVLSAKVFNTSVKLLAVCLSARLPFKCLKKLLDSVKDLSDLNPWPILDRENGLGLRDRRLFQENIPKFFPHRFELRKGLPLADDQDDVRIFNNGEVVPIYYPSGAKKLLGEGAFGEVFEAKIHPRAHHFSKDKHEIFALKQFSGRMDSSERGNREKFDQERRALEMIQKFRTQPHDHIVRYLAAWSRRNNFYILFELASIDLKTFIAGSDDGYSQSSKPLRRKIPRQQDSRLPIIDEKFEDWIMEQVTGLAQALAYVHEITFDYRSESSLVSRNSSTLQIPHVYPYRPRAVGFHHDIKLDNVLVFNSVTRGYGTFKLGDFGSARVKLSEYYTVNRTPQMARQENGAVTYTSPDLELKGETTRKTDVWALGCVFLELMLWCFDREFTVPRFSQERLNDDKGPSRTNRFWQTTESESTAALKPCVSKKIEILRQHCRKRKYFKVWFDCVEGMLQVDAEERIRAHKLSNILSDNYRRLQYDREWDTSSISDDDGRDLEPELPIALQDSENDMADVLSAGPLDQTAAPQILVSRVD